jgi:hypothetical protein
MLLFPAMPRLPPCFAFGVALIWLAAPLPCRAQPTAPRDELLALVPADVGLCLLIGDLRGNAQKWDRSPWVQSLRQSALVKSLVESPEARQIAALEGELQKHLGVDWPTLRDDILGDAVLFAYRPGTAARPELEQGMIAVHARRPKLLAELVDRFNRLQKAGGELKSLEPIKYQGTTYHRREHVRSTHWYYLHGPVLIVAGDEDMLRAAIGHELGAATTASPWPARFARAGSAQALAALAVNPRAFEPFAKPAKLEQPQGFARFWQALDGIFVTLSVDPALEVRVSLQGRTREMPAWSQALFAETQPPSRLWQQFPEPALLTVATRTDFANLADQLLEILPLAERRKLKDGLAELRNLTGVDLLRDMLPNIGPDWGVCILPPADGAAYPNVIAALAVKPGTGPAPVDGALLKGVLLLADLAIADHNTKNPGVPIRIDTIKQGKVTVKVLVQDKLFPTGVRPACAVKDGFFLIASSPDAIARFSPRDPTPAIKGETPLVRVSPLALSQLLKSRRAQVLLDLEKKHQFSAREAERTLDHFLGLLALFDAVTITQRSEPGQASWILRIVPRTKP